MSDPTPEVIGFDVLANAAAPTEQDKIEALREARAANDALHAIITAQQQELAALREKVGAPTTGPTLEAFARGLSLTPGDIGLHCRLFLPQDGSAPRLALRSWDQSAAFTGRVVGNTVTRE